MVGGHKGTAGRTIMCAPKPNSLKQVERLTLTDVSSSSGVSNWWLTYSSANFSLSNASSLSHSFSEDLKVRVSKKGNEIQKKGGHLRWKRVVMMRCWCNVVWLRFSAVWQLLLQRMTRCVLWVLYAQFIISYVLHWGCGLFPPCCEASQKGGKVQAK